MPVPEDTAQGPARPRTGNSGPYLQALRVPAAVACIVGVALVAYYWLYVQRQSDYFTNRNFRMLAIASHQLEGTLESAADVVRHLSQPGPAVNLDLARRSTLVPILSLVPKDTAPLVLSGNTKLAPALVDSTSINWAVGPVDEKAKPLPIALDGLLQPVLARYAGKDLFDSVLLVTAGGRVLLQVGDRTLGLSSLANLVQSGNASSDKTPEPRLSADAVARSADAFDLQIASTSYKIFVEPCCPAAHTLDGKERGWLVAGLVSNASLRSASLAGSFSVMALLAGLLLAALFSWPFVKLTLIGPRQRVRFHDLVLVGFCTMFGGALVTVAVLDFYSYQKLKADLDGQLEGYARSIAENVATELDAATEQLGVLDAASSRLEAVGVEIPNLAGPPTGTVDVSRYPLFESFSLLDLDGMQQRKWALGVFVPPRISVAGRQYFTHWQIARPNEKRFVEPVRSLTTGNRDIVISKPAINPKFHVAALSVQQFRSLVDTVTVPGFGFAIVNRQGELLFHFDRQHDGSEDFFAEVDGNRRLRALIDARQRGWMDLQNGGGAYRAYASPMALEDIPDWSLVTFFDKQLAQTVNIDWLVLTSLFFAIYSSVYLLVLVVVHVTRPAYRAPWIWPASDLNRAYIQIAIVMTVLGGGWLAGFAALSNTELLWTAWLLPFAGWAIAYCRLDPPSASHPGRVLLATAGVAVGVLWFVVVREHWITVSTLGGLLAAVLLSLRWRPGSLKVADALPVTKFCYGTAAAAVAILTIVLPAASFFKVAHAIQATSFVKYGELRLALAVDERESRALTQRDRQLPVGVIRLQAQRDRFDLLGIYHRFFYGTETAPAAASGACRPDEPSVDDLPEGLEEVLPFYSESSIRLRELTHDRAYDQRWQWCVRDGSLLMNLHRPSGDLRYRSDLPVLFGAGPRPAVASEVLAVLLGVLAVAAVLRWTIRFIMTRIFLIDLIDPLWSARTSGPVSSGANLLMVTRAPLLDQFFHLDNYTVVDLGAAGSGDADRQAWEREAWARLNTAEDWKNVLVLQADLAAKDSRLKGALLRLLEHAIDGLNRTVLMVSAQPAFVLGRSDTEGAADVDVEMRWARLLTTFVVVPAGILAGGSVAPPAWANPESGGRLGRLLWYSSMGFLTDEASDLHVLKTWSMLVPSAPAPLDASQWLVEAGERLDRYYGRIWQACSPDEQLVLLQIAEEGLCNQKSSRIVRRLMARGLVARRRNIRLVSETFRRFVLSDGVRSDAATLEEQSTGAWDGVRTPFLAVLVATMAFFFATQHELFNTTLGVITGVAAGVPTILKLVSLLGEKGRATQ